MGVLDPKTLFSDGGVPFSKKLLTQFKAYRVTCAIVKKVKRQPHRVAQYLILHERLGPDRLSVHDEAETLSHALLLLLAKFELDMQQNRKKLPPVPEPVVTLPQPTEVELNYSLQSRGSTRRETPKRECLNERGGETPDNRANFCDRIEAELMQSISNVDENRSVTPTCAEPPATK